MSPLPLRWNLPPTQPDRSLDRRAAHFERRLRLAESRGDSVKLEKLQEEYDHFLGAWHAQDELRELVPDQLPLASPVDLKPEVRHAIRERLRACHAAGLDAELDPFLFAGALYVIGEFAEALNELQGMPESDSHGAQLELRKGLCLVRLDRWYEALRNFEVACELDPANSAALSGKGLALEHLGRSEEALVHYGRALESNPRQAETHFRIGECLTKLNRSGMACLAYDRALALAPGHKPYRQHRARSLLHEGRLDAALLAYDELLPHAGPVASLPSQPRTPHGELRVPRRSRRKRRTLRGRWIAAGSLSLGLVAGWHFSTREVIQPARPSARPTTTITTQIEEPGRTASFQAPRD